MKTNLEMILAVIDKGKIILKRKKDYQIIPIEKIVYCIASGSYSELKFEKGPVKGRFVLEVNFSAEVLPIGIFYPSIKNTFILVMNELRN